MIKDRARLELRAPVSKVQVPPSLLHRLLICNRGQVSQQTELSKHWVVLGSHMAPGHLCGKASRVSGMESPSAPLSVDCDPSLAPGAWVSKPFGNNICLSRCFNFKAIHLPHPKSLWPHLPLSFFPSCKWPVVKHTVSLTSWASGFQSLFSLTVTTRWPCFTHSNIMKTSFWILFFWKPSSL